MSLKTKPRAGEMDVHIGAQILKVRTIRNVSQETLADGIGITFQQIQKYESGKNRVSASTLAKISEVLTVPVYVFFPAEYSINAVKKEIKNVQNS